MKFYTFWVGEVYVKERFYETLRREVHEKNAGKGPYP